MVGARCELQAKHGTYVQGDLEKGMSMNKSCWVYRALALSCSKMRLIWWACNDRSYALRGRVIMDISHGQYGVTRRSC